MAGPWPFLHGVCSLCVQYIAEWRKSLLGREDEMLEDRVRDSVRALEQWKVDIATTRAAIREYEAAISAVGEQSAVSAMYCCVSYVTT